MMCVGDGDGLSDECGYNKMLRGIYKNIKIAKLIF